MSDKKVSMIVPVYNSARYLAGFVDSILTQTMPQSDYEVIFVDDGSSDNSGDILDKYVSQYGFMQVIHQWNSGPAAARNAGFKKATGEYVAFVDPDDILMDKYLENSYAKAAETGADIVLFDACRESVIPNTLQSVRKPYSHDDFARVKRKQLSHADHAFFADDPDSIRSMQAQILYPYMPARVANITFHRNVPLAAPWDKLYRRKFLIANDISFPKDLRVLDDMCFNFRAFGAARTIYYFPTFLYRYRVGNSSITTSYRTDRIIQDKKVFDYLEKEIATITSLNEKYNNKDNTELDNPEDASLKYVSNNELLHLKQAFYARIIKSFAIATKLYFFNPGNPKNQQQIRTEIIDCLSSVPYKTALAGIRLHNLEPKLIAVALACKLRAVGALKMMYRLQYNIANWGRL